MKIAFYIMVTFGLFILIPGSLYCSHSAYQQGCYLQMTANFIIFFGSILLIINGWIFAYLLDKKQTQALLVELKKDESPISFFSIEARYQFKGARGFAFLAAAFYYYHNFVNHSHAVRFIRACPEFCQYFDSPLRYWLKFMHVYCFFLLLSFIYIACISC